MKNKQLPNDKRCRGNNLNKNKISDKKGSKFQISLKKLGTRLVKVKHMELPIKICINVDSD